MLKAMMVAGGLLFGLNGAGEKVPQVVAHRGGSDEQDENTLAGFKSSFEKGVRGFETDVRLTKDRRIVVLHDETLERTTTGKGKVETMTAEEIAPARTKKSGQPLAYLEELLDFLKDKEGAFVQVEIKCKGYTDADVAEMCALMVEMVKTRIDPAKVIFISFEPRALLKIKALKADQQTCLVADEASAHVVKTALEIRAEGVSVQLNNLSRAFVRDAHKAGLKVTTWTIKNAEDAQFALALGVDSVASDVPAAQLAQKTARP